MLLHRPFYFLRHGETEWNVDGRAQGQADIPLNETGVAQAKRAAEIVKGLGIATICTSPLSRAYETARMSAEAAGLPLHVIDDLKECSFGTAEGLPRGPWILDFWKKGIVPEGAEPFPDFLARALRGINTALAMDGPVLIVAHAGIYRCVLHETEIPPMGVTPNAVPIRHEPPNATMPGWAAEVLTSDES